jgi:penicillin amidase
MWADTAGNIAWWAAGKLPVRPPHVNPQVILDGSTGQDDPLGWLPFAQNPQIVNPPRGVLYTANNQPADMGSGLVYGYYVPSHRARRIEELLFTDKSDWTESSVRAVINDVQVSAYPEILKKVLPVMDTARLGSQASKAYAILRTWEGRHDLEDIAPTIFYKFIYEVYQLAFLDELGIGTLRNFENTLSLKRNTIAFLQNDSSGWWDNVNTHPKERRAEMLTKALEQAAKALTLQLGDDPQQWQWKKVHSIEHKHPLGILPVAGKWFNVGPLPVNGGQETLNNLDFFLDSTGLYPVKSGPALRRIVDFTSPRQASSVNPTGQSGHFMSPHYNDQAQMFADGGRRPEHVDREKLDKVKIARMVLRPVQ